MKRSFVSLALCVAALTGSFWGGMQWRSWRAKMIAGHQARWMARYWEDGQPIGSVCDRIALKHGVRIFRDQWVAGEGPDAALGPVVGVERVCVRRDRSIYWRPAE